MTWTKRQFINAAFDELTMGDYEFDISPGEYQSALIKLDAMMADWDGDGIRIGYPLPSTQSDSSLDTITTVPDWANQAIYTNLAVRLSTSFGKMVSIETKKAAKKGYNILYSKNAMPNQMQFPNTLPLGAGNKPWRNGNIFVPTPVDRLQAGQDETIDFY